MEVDNKVVLTKILAELREIKEVLKKSLGCEHKNTAARVKSNPGFVHIQEAETFCVDCGKVLS